MSAEVKKEIELELAHVLFIDIVGYSKLLINDQRALLAGTTLPPWQNWPAPPCAVGLGDQKKANAALLAARERAAVAMRQQPEDGKALMVLAQIDAALGRKEDALREGARAIELLPVTQDALLLGNALLTRLAGIYAQVGETTRAFELLGKVSEIPFGVTYGSLELDEAWDRLRGGSAFRENRRLACAEGQPIIWRSARYRENRT